MALLHEVQSILPSPVAPIKENLCTFPGWTSIKPWNEINANP
jgi:hypothetical protein